MCASITCPLSPLLAPHSRLLPPKILPSQASPLQASPHKPATSAHLEKSKVLEVSAQAGDLAEYRAIRAALPGGHVRLNGTKSMIGHLLGAAGAVEAVATVQAIRTGARAGALQSAVTPLHVTMLGCAVLKWLWSCGLGTLVGTFADGATAELACSMHVRVRLVCSCLLVLSASACHSAHLQRPRNA